MYKLLLCWRYLLTRRLALACIISVMLGVATLIVVNSVMSGFSTKLKDRLHGLISDVIVESYNYDGFPDPEEKMQRVMNSPIGHKIQALTPTIEILGLLQVTFEGQQMQPRTVHIIGTNAQARARVGSFAEFLTEPANKQNPSFDPGPEAQRWHDEHWAPLPAMPFEQVQGPAGTAPPPVMPELQQKKLAGIFVGDAIGHVRVHPEGGKKAEVFPMLHRGDEVVLYTIRSSARSSIASSSPISSRPR